ncbi:MAG: 3-deoxy-7-phosphoheptulonate synthase [Terriglobia bacterium]
MVVVMQEGASEAEILSVIDRLIKIGFDVHRSTGALQTVLGGVGAKADFDTREIELLGGVQEVHRIIAPYKLASRHFRPEGSVIQLAPGVVLGDSSVVMMAGPCSVESPEQIETIAEIVARQGVRVLRGGAFKPRTSPYSFQGLGLKGLEYMRRAADRHHLLVVSEVMDHTQIPAMLELVDLFQVGARNMQNFNLLKELGKIAKPVLLKRGISATVEELLLSAEYIMSGGNYNVVLCERGIRTFENSMRNTLDVSAIPMIHKLSHLPIIADPSHATGRRDQVLPMARAAVAAGADGLLLEVHHDPENALSDGPQALYPHQFAELAAELKLIASAVRRTLT